MFDRLEIILGSDNLDKIKSKRVAVVGIGGVGGYAVESLVRSGIENIILIDYDIVDITNKNRQIIALDSTIGMKKVDAFHNRIKDINKECNVYKENIFLSSNNINEVLKDVDYVLDACDSVSTKVEIIKYCLNNSISFISCMGMGKKINPSLLEITDLSKTSYDPLAKKVRNMLKHENINGKIPVVFSKEVPINSSFKEIGSTPFVPAVAGLLMANYVIKDIISR